MAKTTIPSSGLWGTIANSLNAMFDERYDNTGWGNYTDTVYTSGSPLALVADTDTILLNNKGTVNESQLPTDITTFYDGDVITGQNGDAYTITVELKAVPTQAGTDGLELWFDIGGSVGELYRRLITYPKGQGEIRRVLFTTAVYTLDTWESNGATVYVNSNGGTANVYDIRYVIHRIHKAQ